MKPPSRVLDRFPAVVIEGGSRPSVAARTEWKRKTGPVYWRVEGHEFVHCNSTEGCPCGLSTWFGPGQHHALAGVIIERGFRGATNLDGLKLAAALSWPGAIRDGKGALIPILDQRATADQAEALLRVMGGEANDRGASFFEVFSSAYESVHRPVFAAIELDRNEEDCTLHLTAAGPQGNAVEIGLAHRFEDIFAAIGQGWSHDLGVAPLNLLAPIVMAGQVREPERAGYHREGFARIAADLNKAFSFDRTSG